MRNLIAFAIAALLFGCASTGSEYKTVYDHKYNQTRVVRADSPGPFVGTSAVYKPSPRLVGQHP